MTNKVVGASAKGKLVQSEMIAVVTRIRHQPDCQVYTRDVCNCDSTETYTEDLGVVSYYHRNPLRRWWWNYTNRNKPGRASAKCS